MIAGETASAVTSPRSDSASGTRSPALSSAWKATDGPRGVVTLSTLTEST